MQTFTDPHTDETFTFPIRLHKDFRKWCAYEQFDSIDDVNDFLETADLWFNPDGEEPIDDLYRLCIHIRNAWQAQRKY